MVKRGMALGAALATFAVSPAVAEAVDRYVDAETGADTTSACTLAAPCETIAHAIANAGNGDRILVDSGTYNESLTLGNELGLAFQDFVAGDGTAPAVLDGGASTAITVPASGAGRIGDLVIRSDASSQVALNGPAEVDGNTFDDPDAAGTVVAVQVSIGAEGSDVHDNTFVDPAPSTTRGRLAVYSPFTPVTIQDNTIQNLNVGIQVGLNNGGQTLVAGNEITGTHNLPFAGQAIIASAATGSVVLRSNTISDPVGAGVVGVSAGVNSSLVRNAISGLETGVSLSTNTTGVTLDGDRIWASTGFGLRLTDNGVAAPKTSATATNVTIWSNAGADISLSESALTLDSSIIEDIGWSGGSTCAITYSRADAAGADPTGCDGFQFTAAPDFADDDFHLASTSPLIDQGNPAAPAAGATDFDGDARAIDATPACAGNVERRDIGADEFLPTFPDCTPPQTTIDAGPANGSTTNDPTPTFAFSSELGATFECSADGVTFGACSDPGEHTFSPLPDGGHTFAVRATDSAANTDPSPATRNFTVDTVPPETEITRGPRARTTKRTARLAWRGEDASATTFRCSLDAKPFRACATSKTYRRLALGRHRFRVRATDAAGNVEAAPAIHRWRIIRRG